MTSSSFNCKQSVLKQAVEDLVEVGMYVQGVNCSNSSNVR